MMLRWCFFAAFTSFVLGQDTNYFAERDEDGIQARQQPGVVSSSDFLRRAYHGSVVVGDYVYIDGGAFSYMSSGSPVYDYSTTTLSIGLSSSWTNASVVINSNSKPSGVPNLDDNTLWYDSSSNSLLAGFGGAAPRFNTPSPYALGLWSFALDGQGGGTWSAITAATTSLRKSFTRPYQGLSTWGGDSAFTIGGYINDLTSPATANYTGSEPLPGIVQYNMTSGTFKNSSAAGYNFNGTAERGVLHYVPSFGPEGIYVLLGGDISGYQGYTAGSDLQSFSSLTIYDPASGNFYNQTATGNIPQARIEFCATGINSTNETYEIFMYAGWGSNLGSAALPFDEIYILTLPAFEWIKVNYAPAHPRHGHSCHTVGNRQMLVIGGVDSSADSTSSSAPTLDKATFATADQFTQGLAIFDMTDLTWSSGYDANAAEYEQSDSVQTFYSSRTSKDPTTWGSPALQTLFQTTHFTAATNTSTNTTSTSTPIPTPSSKSSSSNAGAIAGGVVGGVAGLALLAGLGWFFFRRRQKKNTNTAELAANGEANNAVPGTGTTFAGHPVTDYKYQPVAGPNGTYASPTMSEVHADPVAHQMPTPSDYGGGGHQFASELETREQHELP
ncbi:uncharacterized protein LY89DRAFT_785046 [Mollisia scopiformis]|uniref:Kelch repeat protein n=1 Tax=Mollisia scopiformis TaxID=149040 RepID=A0A194X040_MOLSC|nr:uncharacterized protein LY89DRAFT_785046 [Mollisia scopiformis]KUJ13319.1 hypothetical protein LY89DRAFT_785046 [Mollisia scopiformis]